MNVNAGGTAVGLGELTPFFVCICFRLFLLFCLHLHVTLGWKSWKDVKASCDIFSSVGDDMKSKLNLSIQMRETARERQRMWKWIPITIGDDNIFNKLWVYSLCCQSFHYTGLLQGYMITLNRESAYPTILFPKSLLFNIKNTTLKTQTVSGRWDIIFMV